ncbi:hypothetical protein PWT90_04750 [Aphanocladium album]|nr:hypothetical protein PWT90_04750 [Aphanocladium album]
MTALISIESYAIGWIAALYIERAAAIAQLDDRHEAPADFEQHLSDTNSYTWGRIGKHNVVIASLPAGIHGTTAAATTVSNLLASLPAIKIGLLVGIGGGIARHMDQDVRLGDIVVSLPEGTTGGVVQYDLGKAGLNGKWEPTGMLNKPPQVLLNALAALRAEHEMTSSNIPDYLEAMWTKMPQMKKSKKREPGYIHQGFENDRLFSSAYNHVNGQTCDNCDASEEIQRDIRDTTDPKIHYGIIASGNTLVKDARMRNQIAELVGSECLCVEMEAAGLMDRFPCLVIRGICDYADSHKNDQWQRYAAATAAAYAKELLGHVPVKQLQASHRAVDILGSMSEEINRLGVATTSLQNSVHSIQTFVRDSSQRGVLAHLEGRVAAGACFDSAAEQHNPRCLPNTRVDLLQRVTEWTVNSNSEAIFWLNGMAGTGKSTISRTVAESVARDGQLGASFFFKRGEGDQSTMAKFCSTIAADLTRRDPTIARLVKEAIETDPSIFRKSMREQFNKLILQPLSLVQKKDPIVIIVDALDECDEEDNVKLMIYLFSQAKTLDSIQLKVFLTSRPDLPPRLGFKAIEGKYQDLILHEIPKFVVKHDISLFLQKELLRIRHDYNTTVPEDRQLSKNWPTQSDISLLVQMAIPLFIYAATICRFIGDRRLGTPNSQLKKVFQPRPGHHLSKLGSTYLPVLDNLIVGTSAEQQTEILRQFRYIVGSIIILASPLSTTTLARLLYLSRDDIDSSKKLHEFLHDAERFILANVSIIDGTPLQLYSSLVIFAPESSIVRITFTKQLPGWILLKPRVDRNWSQTIQTLEGHSGSVHSVAYSPDCTLIASASYDRSVRLWRSDTGECLQTLEGHSSSVNSVAFSPDGRLIASACDDGVVRVWRADTSKCIWTFEGHDDFVSSVAFSPDNTVIASASNDQTVRLWHLSTGTCYYILKAHRGFISSVAFSSNGSFIASASYDRTIRLWRVDTGECVQTLDGHGSINSMAFSPDGTLIALASYDKTIRLCRSATGECTQILEGHSGSISLAAFSPNGTLIASASNDKTVRLWRVSTGECVCILQGHGSSVSSVAFSPDNSRIVSAAQDKTIRLWDLTIRNNMQTLEGHSKCINLTAFSPDGTLISSASYDKTVRLWCGNTGECLQILRGHGDAIFLTAISSDNTLFASVSYDKTIRLWRVNTGECVWALKGYGGSIKVVTFSPDGTLIAICNDKTLQLCRVNTGECVQTFKRHSRPINSVAFSPDGTLVASSDDRIVRLWRVNTGECVQTLKGHGPFMSCSNISFDDDDKRHSMDAGIIGLRGRTNPDSVLRSGTSAMGYSRSDLGISDDNCWITWNGEKILWLPKDFRPSCSAIFRNVVAVGNNSGKLIVMSFSSQELAKSLAKSWRKWPNIDIL